MNQDLRRMDIYSPVLGVMEGHQRHWNKDILNMSSSNWNTIQVGNSFGWSLPGLIYITLVIEITYLSPNLWKCNSKTKYCFSVWNTMEKYHNQTFPPIHLHNTKLLHQPRWVYPNVNLSCFQTWKVVQMMSIIDLDFIEVNIKSFKVRFDTDLSPKQQDKHRTAVCTICPEISSIHTVRSYQHLCSQRDFTLFSFNVTIKNKVFKTIFVILIAPCSHYQAFHANLHKM